MEITRFASDDLESVLVSHPERIEGLPFGAIQIDRDGIVLRYNNAQGLIWDRNSIDMVGKSFFDDVAPCCRNTPVQFAFNKFLAQGFIDVLHDHEILYGGRFVNVHIHLKAAVGADGCWLFTKFIRSATPSPAAD